MTRVLCQEESTQFSSSATASIIIIDCFPRKITTVLVLVTATIMMMARCSTASAWISSPIISKRTVFSSSPSFRRFVGSNSLSRLPLEENDYDVIVVGGGHAGCDAAAAAARTGARTALVTQRLDTIGELSCNPSIGGIGKGHLVREIDALDGLMGEIADQGGVHYRVLNRRKGPAVRGPRAQMDRDLYKSAMQATLAAYENLSLVEASVEDLLLDESDKGVESLAPLSSSSTSEDSSSPTKRQELAATSQKYKARIRGIVATLPNGSTVEIMSRAVVITTGTFLRGVLMIGKDKYSGGRHLRDSEKVEPPSVGLAKTLERFEFPLSRLKTGTPARIDGSTIDWSILQPQPSEIPATPFSHLLQFNGEQPPMLAANKIITCFQTATNEKTHELVMKYESLLPEYDGLDGAGNGPRYCPSIYKKVVRFPERTGHNCFLEPEGLNTDIVYPNGMSGPYPEEIQLKILRSMKGLENVEIVRPGYDVEYDFIQPTSLTHTLETKKIAGLYLAGQICGTTGYEEAAAQGIVAGANAGKAAAAAATGEKSPSPFILGRDEGYIGVLIDDLVTRGTSEPYRMFTSRAEYRISLRADNADLRLTRKGMEHNLVRNEERMATLDMREDMIDKQIQKLKIFDMKVTQWAERGGNDLMGGAQISKKTGTKKTAEEVLQMPNVSLRDVENIMEAISNENNVAEGQQGSIDTLSDFAVSPPSIADTVEASIKYQSYEQRQHRDMESWRRAQGMRIPPDLVYEHCTFPTFSKEELEKLSDARPNTFAEASAISGVTPQSLVYLYHHVTRRNRRRDQSREQSVVA